MSPPFETVQLEDAVVSLATVGELRAEADRLDKEAASLAAAATRSRGDAVARLAEAGLVLVGRAGEWTPAHPEAAHQLDEVRRLIRVIDEQDGGPGGGDAEKKGGLAGLFGRRKQPVEEPGARQAREERASQMRVMLAELGRNYGVVLPAVAAAHEKAMAMEEQAAGDRAAAEAVEAEAGELRQQAERRERAAAEMGFDALHLSATLVKTPPGSVESPLALRAGEQAFLVEPADLARDKNPVVLPAEVPVTNYRAFTTGIRYRVGVRREGAVRQDSLSVLGPGVFVVTNQRLGFVGKLKSFSFPVESLVHVEHQDGSLALVREGRDHADVVLTPAASRILFYINYVMRLPRER